jgi:hypothetical protein
MMSSVAEAEKIEQRVVLRGVSWDTYKRLCADCVESHAAHFFFDRAIFAAVRVSEVWHYDGAHVAIWVLAGDDYVPSPVSRALPGLAAADIESWLEQAQEMKRNEWVKRLRAWVRQRFPAP